MSTAFKKLVSRAEDLKMHVRLDRDYLNTPVDTEQRAADALRLSVPSTLRAVAAWFEAMAEAIEGDLDEPELTLLITAGLKDSFAGAKTGLAMAACEDGIRDWALRKLGLTLPREKWDDDGRVS